MFALQNNIILGTVTDSHYSGVHLGTSLLLRTAEGRLGGPVLPPFLHTASNTLVTFLTGVTTESGLSH